MPVRGPQFNIDTQAFQEMRAGLNRAERERLEDEVAVALRKRRVNDLWRERAANFNVMSDSDLRVLVNRLLRFPLREGHTVSGTNAVFYETPTYYSVTTMQWPTASTTFRWNS